MSGKQRDLVKAVKSLMRDFPCVIVNNGDEIFMLDEKIIQIPAIFL